MKNPRKLVKGGTVDLEVDGCQTAEPGDGAGCTCGA